MKTNYSTSQSVLYETCRIILQNCKNNLALFTAFSAVYTLAFVDAIIAEVSAAENMPSEDARSLAHKTFRQEMIALGKTCRHYWQGLKRYIAKAFAPEFQEMNWTAAGWAFYDEASNESWDKVNEMMVMGSQYLADHGAELTDMPVGYPVTFNTSKTNFSTKLSAFLAAEIAAREGTDDKIKANNTLYAKVIEICADGQHIFSEDETVKEEFSFEKMSELVKPTGAAGLKGTVTKNGEPQPGLIVELENGDLSVITDAEGEFDFGNKLASGNDTIIVKQGDEILAEEDVVIPPGVTKTEEVELPNTPPVA